MNDDWRYNPERLEERRFCLSALVMKGVVIDKKVYAFCHDFTSSGACQGLLEKFLGKADAAAFEEIYLAYQTYLMETDMGPEPELVPMEGVDPVG